MITIGVPRGHFIAPWDFFFCLYNVKAHLDNQHIPSWLLTVEGPIIEENRNRIIKQTPRNSYLIMIDDDMTFNKGDVSELYKTMINNKLDICCGIFSDEYKQARIQRKGKFLKDYPKETLFEIDACGMAFTMFSSKVVETFKKEKPFERIGELGEDLSFCKRAKDKGFKVFCDSKVKVGHLRLASIFSE